MQCYAAWRASKSYRRGLDYFAHGHVESIEEDGLGVEATVRGTQDYSVTLALDEGVLDYACDCPSRKRRHVLQTLRCGGVRVAASG